VKPWKTELPALKEGPSAVAMSMGTTELLPGSSEDCLYLNVYAKKVSTYHSHGVEVIIERDSV